MSSSQAARRCAYRRVQRTRSWARRSCRSTVRTLSPVAAAISRVGETRDLEREEVSLARAQLSDAGERRARLELKLNGRPRVLDQLDSEQRIAAATGNADIERILAPVKAGESIRLVDRDRAQPSE